MSNLARLPGLGKKSASRIAYYLLRTDESLTRALADDLARLRQTIRPCSMCGSYTDVDPCGICTDASRDGTSICVVEEPRDVLTIESIHEHRGLYHVLMGAISPIDGIGPDSLRIASLIERVKSGGLLEISSGMVVGSAFQLDGRVVTVINPSTSGAPIDSAVFPAAFLAGGGLRARFGLSDRILPGLEAKKGLLGRRGGVGDGGLKGQVLGKFRAYAAHEGRQAHDDDGFGTHTPTRSEARE